MRNRSARRKTPTIFSYQEFCFFEALRDMTNYQRTYSIGEVEVEGAAIYHKTEYRERRSHYALFAGTHPIAGRDAPCFGEAKNNWLTGSVAWTFVTVSQGLLGILPDYAGLHIDPCIPKAWPAFTATRRFHGNTYQIKVSNPDGVCRGVKRLRHDSVGIDPSAPIPFVADGQAHIVEAVLGTTAY